MKRITAGIALVLPLILMCARDPNPFVASNARAVVIERDFKSETEGGTVEIFSTYRLGIVVAVREQVDSFLVIIPGNRLHQDTMCIRPDTASLLEAKTYEVYFSFYDTGRVTITVITCRRPGEMVISDQILLLVRNPLAPLPITGNLNERFPLRTSSVKDADVWYHWHFGSYPHISTPFAHMETTLTAVYPVVGTGTLRVSDVRGLYRSPRVLFSYSLGDLVAPSIEPISGRARGDTIFSGDTLFTFAVRVTDRGIVDTVWMNGVPVTGSGGVYHQMYSIKNRPALVRVEAVDRSGNRSDRLFTLTYDSTIEPGSDLILRIVSPSRDSMVTGDPRLRVIGTAQRFGRHEQDTMRIHVFVNGRTAQSGTALSGEVWGFDPVLVDSVNRLNLSIMGADGRVLRDTTLTVLYRPQSEDRHSPVIADIRVNGTSAMHVPYVVTPRDVAVVEILAFDEGSGIELLSLAGKRLFPASEHYWWRDTVALKPGRTELVVYARDRSYNPASQGFTIVRNRAPVPGNNPSSLTATVGVPLRQVFSVLDPDADTVRMEMVPTIAGMAVSGLAFQWTPRPEQVGVHTVAAHFFDRYEHSTHPMTIEVFPGYNHPCRLSVALGDSAVYDSLRIGDRPLVLTFTIHDDDPVSIERYEVTIVSGATEVIKRIDTARVFEATINPLPAGASFDTVRVFVQDRGGNRDSVMLRVVREHGALRSYRINTTGVDGGAGINQPVMNFPLLIRADSLSTNPLALAGKGGIYFQKSDGTELPYYLEGWDPVSGTCWFWVLIDTVHPNDNSRRIELCWDPRRFLITPNPRQVFDTTNGFRLVYHLDTAVAGLTTPAGYRNSAQNQYHAGKFSSAPTRWGVVGRAAGFDGIDDYLDLGTPDIRGTELTISCWFRVDTIGFYPRLVSKTASWDVADHFWMVSLHEYSDIRPNRSPIRFRLHAGGSTAELTTADSPVQTGMWTYVVARYDGSSMRIYCYTGQSTDGLVATMGKTGLLGLAPSVNAWIGGNPPDPRSRPFKGLIDEVRIESKARSEAWIKLCYETQKPGSRVVRSTVISKPSDF